LRLSTTASALWPNIVEGDCRLVCGRNHVYKSFAILCQSIVADLDIEDAKWKRWKYMEGDHTSWVKIKNS
jgi:hypothetical protein